MFRFLINRCANAFETNITKLNFTCDTLYHNPFFISLIIDVNINSGWLPFAQNIDFPNASLKFIKISQ